MKNKSTKSKVYVMLTAIWGNDDADSTIKLSHTQWEAIRAGAEYETSTWSWYEGKRFPVNWSFVNGCVSIFGEDGMECLIDYPVDDLNIEMVE
jgi:hypothetical protein